MITIQGLLLTFIGMQSINLVIPASDSLVRLGDITSEHGLPVWLSLGGLMLLSTLTYHGIKGAVLIGILAVTLLVWFLNDTWPTKLVEMPQGLSAMGSVDFNTLGTCLEVCDRVVPRVKCTYIHTYIHTYILINIHRNGAV
jgi:xanthine/uracil/vitamin C permease (AzgA family)